MCSLRLRAALMRFKFLVARLVIAFQQVGKAGGIVQEGEVELANRPIALLGDDDFSSAFEVGVVLLVDFLPKNKHNNVGILLDRSGFPEIGELRTVVAAAALR